MSTNEKDNDKPTATKNRWKHYQNLAHSLLIQQSPSVDKDESTDSYLTQPTADDPMKWNGWGYQDTFIYVNKSNEVEISGKRYEQTFPSSVRVLPKLREWAEAELSLNMDRQSFPNTAFPNLPKPVVNQVLEEQLTQHEFKFSAKDIERIHHSHGQTCKVKSRYDGCCYSVWSDIIVDPTYRNYFIYDILKRSRDVFQI